VPGVGRIVLVVVAACGCGGASTPAAPDPSDVGTPFAAALDSVMGDFMAMHDIGAGLLGVMKDGSVVYQRGHGWSDPGHTRPLSDDAMMRLASVTKPVTAALIHELVREGLLDLDDYAFDLGQPGGGILALAPFPTLGDPRLRDVRVIDLLRHEGGWDRSVAGDLTYREVAVAQAMGVTSPPGRERTVRYILGRPLEFDPGSRSAYSNIGYLVLGLIAEEVTGTTYMGALRSRVLDPLDVPPEDLIPGRTFPEDRSGREPWYDSDELVENVFDPTGPPVRRPAGGWDHEARVGQGGLVATPGAILALLDTYLVSGDLIGARRSGAEGASWRRNHTGSLPGTNALARQRGDGINYVVLFNRRPGSGSSYASLFRAELDRLLDSGRLEW
jgi:CubicO group peptidase (beta-lactamase class C family)